MIQWVLWDVMNMLFFCEYSTHSRCWNLYIYCESGAHGLLKSKHEYHADAEYENPLKYSEKLACVGQRYPPLES